MTHAKRLVIPLALGLSLAGCAGTSPPSRFYVLEPTLGQVEPITRMPKLSIGLGPLTLPDLLDRPQILTRSGPYQLDLAEFERWGGDLGANLGRLAAQRIGARLGTERVSLHPWPRQRQLDLQVRVDLTRFDGRPGTEAWLQGTFALLDGPGDRELRLEGFDLRQAVSGTQYADLAAALSALAERLADRIAEVMAEEMARRTGAGK